MLLALLAVEMNLFDRGVAIGVLLFAAGAATVLLRRGLTYIDKHEQFVRQIQLDQLQQSKDHAEAMIAAAEAQTAERKELTAALRAIEAQMRRSNEQRP